MSERYIKSTQTLINGRWAQTYKAKTKKFGIVLVYDGKKLLSKCAFHLSDGEMVNTTNYGK